MFVKEKAAEQLKQAQGKSTARILTIDQVERLLEAAEEWIAEHKLPGYALKYTHFEYQEMVPNSYKMGAKATKLTATLTQKGTIKAVSFERDWARNNAWGGEINRLVLDYVGMFNGEYSFERKSYNHDKMMHRYIGFLGFNGHGTVCF